MKILLRFLIVQSLLLWQGGFLFYAAVVVPTVAGEYSVRKDKVPSPPVSRIG